MKPKTRSLKKNEPAATPTLPPEEAPAPPSFFVRHSANLGAKREGAVTATRENKILRGSSWYKVSEEQAAELREFPLHEGPGRNYGEPNFVGRFDVLDEATFNTLVESEQTRLGAEALDRARDAALAAIAIEKKQVSVAIDLGATSARPL